MTVHHLPGDVRGLVFDIDSTLYRNADYVTSQQEVQIRKAAEELGRPYQEVREEIEAYRRRITEERGRTPALAEVFRDRFGFPIAAVAVWRETLIEPERYLAPDPRLMETMEVLASRYRIMAVTNNPVRIGERTLESLGIRRRFLDVLGLDSTMETKPSIRPYRLAAERLECPFERIVNIGDRYGVDLELPLQEGMGAILVESMEDIYRLPEVLPAPRASDHSA